MLNRIRVKNFKSFKDLDYPCAKLNLLMGVNGAGKSSFVQLMLLMRRLAQQPLKAKITIPVGECSVSYEDLRYAYAGKEEEISFSIDFTPRASIKVCETGKTSDGGTLLDWDSLYALFPIDPTPDEIAADSIISMRRIIHGKKQQLVFWNLDFASSLFTLPELHAKIDFLKKHGGEEDSILLSSDIDLKQKYFELRRKLAGKYKELETEYNKYEDKISPYYAFLWRNMKFVEAFRMKPVEVHKGGRYSQQEWQSRRIAFDPEGEDVAEFLYKVGSFNILEKDNPMVSPNSPDKRSLIDQVNAWLQVISPGAKVKIDRREVFGSEFFVQSVTFGNLGEEHEFKPQNVGFGISYVLPVLVSLLTSLPEDIVIIENPEAHLHPRGQAEMGNLIARAAAYGIQLFVETHSDHVINGVRVAVKNGIIKPCDVNIAFFERNGHDITMDDGTKSKEYYADVRSIKIDQNGSLSEYPEDFLDEWNNQTMELMKP